MSNMTQIDEMTRFFALTMTRIPYIEFPREIIVFRVAGAGPCPMFILETKFPRSNDFKFV